MFKQKLSKKLFFTLKGRALGVTYIQIGEINSWAIAQNWGTKKRLALRQWLGQFPVIHGSVAVAETWSEIAAFATKRGRPTPVNDSWVAACCLTHDLPLVTMNLRDFRDLSEFEGLELIT